MSNSYGNKGEYQIYNCDMDTLIKEGYYLSTDPDLIFETIQNEWGRPMDPRLQKSTEHKTSMESVKQSRHLARMMRRNNINNNNDYEDFAHDKELIGLKYDKIRGKINFIQISIVVVSTIITFLETVKEKFHLTNDISMTVVPILLSTYIAFMLALSRFFKLDDHKEELCKLDETLAFIMAGLRHRMRLMEGMKPITAESTSEQFEAVQKFLDEQNMDGLEETIENCKQKLDLAMNLREKVEYKNILLKINLDRHIVEDNKNNLTKHKDSLKLHQYKKRACCILQYLCCDWDCCSYSYIDHEKAYIAADKMEKNNPHYNQPKELNTGYRKNSNSIFVGNKCSEAYMDLISDACTNKNRFDSSVIYPIDEEEEEPSVKIDIRDSPTIYKNTSVVDFHKNSKSDSLVLDNSQVQDNSQAQDNSSVQDNSPALDNSSVQDNSQAQDNSPDQDDSSTD